MTLELSYVNLPGDPYIQHHLTKRESSRRMILGMIEVMAITGMVLFLTTTVGYLVASVIGHWVQAAIGFVPDVVGGMAIVLWSLISIGGAFVLFQLGLGRDCMHIIDWANGRERIFTDDH